jgi:hypothetical protein
MNDKRGGAGSSACVRPSPRDAGVPAASFPITPRDGAGHPPPGRATKRAGNQVHSLSLSIENGRKSGKQKHREGVIESQPDRPHPQVHGISKFETFWMNLKKRL